MACGILIFGILDSAFWVSGILNIVILVLRYFGFGIIGLRCFGLGIFYENHYGSLFIACENQIRTADYKQ
jgi:membrane-bound ClpP family serine protease